MDDDLVAGGCFVPNLGTGRRQEYTKARYRLKAAFDYCNRSAAGLACGKKFVVESQSLMYGELVVPLAALSQGLSTITCMGSRRGKLGRTGQLRVHPQVATYYIVYKNSMNSQEYPRLS